MIQSFVFIRRVFFHNNLPDNVLQYRAVTRLYLHNGYICQEFSLIKKKSTYLFTYLQIVSRPSQ